MGLSLDTNRNLLLYVNGVCQGTVASSVAEPAYFFVELYGLYKKVKQASVISWSVISAVVVVFVFVLLWLLLFNWGFC